MVISCVQSIWGSKMCICASYFSSLFVHKLYKFVGRYDESEGMIFAVEEQEDLFHILAELKSGIKEDTLFEKLSEFMPTEEVESFLEQLMQKGIIE